LAVTAISIFLADVLDMEWHTEIGRETRFRLSTATPDSSRLRNRNARSFPLRERFSAGSRSTRE
jgi:hypothetical protein